MAGLFKVMFIGEENSIDKMRAMDLRMTQFINAPIKSKFYTFIANTLPFIFHIIL